MNLILSGEMGNHTFSLKEGRVGSFRYGEKWKVITALVSHDKRSESNGHTTHVRMRTAY